MQKEEIERKFIFNGSSDIYKDAIPKALCQSYLSTQPETRLRQVLESGILKHFMTVKSSGDLSRDEFEIEISHKTYDELHEKAVGNDIIKTRYKVPIEDGLVAVIDVFKDFKLTTVEVEFNDRKKALDFEPPVWFGKEVTSYPTYKNKYISLYGLRDFDAQIV